MYERERKIDEAELQELAAIEAELASFSPEPSRMDRDRIMFLAGWASVVADTTPIAPKVATRRWAAALATMTTVAGCLLLAVIVQQRSIIALRADVPQTTVESSAEQAPVEKSPLEPDRPVENVPSAQPSALVDDFQQRDFKRTRFDFSEERLLTLADTGTLTARSFYMTDDPRLTKEIKTDPHNDWPQHTYDPQSKPLPYYKLLRQMQAAGI